MRSQMLRCVEVLGVLGTRQGRLAVAVAVVMNDGKNNVVRREGTVAMTECQHEAAMRLVAIFGDVKLWLTIDADGRAWLDEIG